MSRLRPPRQSLGEYPSAPRQSLGEYPSAPRRPEEYPPPNQSDDEERASERRRKRRRERRRLAAADERARRARDMTDHDSDYWKRVTGGAVAFAVLSLSAVLAVSKGCREQLGELGDQINQVAKQANQAAKIEPLWKNIWSVVEYFKTDVMPLAEMTQEELREMIQTDPEEFLNLLKTANEKLDIAIESVSKIRAAGLRVNPGVVKEATEQVKAGLRVLRSREVERSMWWVKKLRWFDFAERLAPVVYEAQTSDSKLSRLRKTLLSIVDEDIGEYSNNFFVNASLRGNEDILLTEPGSLYEGMARGNPYGLDNGVLQRRLILMGYMSPGGDDGDFGSGTERALKRLQVDFDVIESIQDNTAGTVDKETLEILQKIKKSVGETCHGFLPPVHKGLIGPDVERVQRRLIDLGELNEGDDDGRFGNGTRRALIRFQKDCGILKSFPAARGRINLPTCACLKDSSSCCNQ